MSVRDLNERVSSIEFTYWQKYFELKQEEEDRLMKKSEKPTRTDDED